jgi:G3E family GTPase
MHDPIPSTVLAGWLGSGKTTLLNELLVGISSERVAVIVNDVGDVNVDAALIERSDGDRIELTNGCICCSIGSSLALTLRDLVVVDDPPDRIIIEASGVAEPARVAQYGDRRRIEAPAIVVTVDATDVLERADDRRYGATVRAQVTEADAVVITKADLVDLERIEDVRSWLAAQAPTTPIVDRATALAPRPSARSIDIKPIDGLEAGMETLTIDFGADVVVTGHLERELAATPGVLRAKGLLTTDVNSCVLVDYSAGRFVSELHSGDVAQEVRNRLVVIGDGDLLGRPEWQRRLRSCVRPCGPKPPASISP